MTGRIVSDIPIGSRLGNYLIKRVIGYGGHAIVYEAVNEQLGKKVAVKVLRPEYSRRAEIEKRFLNEARSVNLIDHPGLVNIFEYGKTYNHCTFIVMEHLNGDSLQLYIEKHSPIPLAKTLYILQRIASVLAATHAAGIIHRDLKPANIIVVADPDVPGGERPKIFDFGIAKVDLGLGLGDGRSASNLTRAGLPLGTPGYMSPEQERQPSNVTDRADVYSLGVIFSELLTSSRPPSVPFDEDLAEPQGPAAAHSPSLPEAIDELRQSMLLADPSQRPTMKAVHQQLTQLIAQLDLTTPRRAAAAVLTGEPHSSPIPLLSSSLAVMLPPENPPVPAGEPAAGAPRSWLAGVVAGAVIFTATLVAAAVGLGNTYKGRPWATTASASSQPAKFQPAAPIPPAPPPPPAVPATVAPRPAESQQPPLESQTGGRDKPAVDPPGPTTPPDRPLPPATPEGGPTRDGADSSRSRVSKSKRRPEAHAPGTGKDLPEKDWSEDAVNHAAVE